MAITSPAKGYLEVIEQLCEILGHLRADAASFNCVLAGELDGYAIDSRWVRKDGRIIDSTIVVKVVSHADRTVDYFVALPRT